MYDPVLLLSAATQSWQHCFSDELVYFHDPLKGDANSLRLPEQYERHQSWFEILAETTTDYIVAMVSSGDDLGRGAKIRRSASAKRSIQHEVDCCADKDSSVLVDIAQQVELPKKDP